MIIEKDRVVSIEYSLTDDEGTLVDSSDGSEPLVYLHGNGNIIEGLETQLAGKKAGDHLTCVVEPAQGYGERDDALVFTVERSQFASGEKVEEGMQFEAHDENGARIVTVVGVEGDKVTIDANHPLAGAKLHFDVKVVEVREALPEELEHGHVHGGHEHGCGDDCDCEGGCDEGGCGCGH